MSETLTIEQAAQRLPELLKSLGPKDEIILKKDDQEVAHIVIGEPEPKKRRVPGALKGILTIISDDDEHLADFKDYMP